eukprot:XP_025014776.1 uncharacterized protein LOC112536340 [Ricinus communis]
MKRKHIIAYFLVALFIASRCHCYLATMVQHADSVDSKLGNAQLGKSFPTKYVFSRKAGTHVKELIHKAPSGPNPIGNRHPPSIHV